MNLSLKKRRSRNDKLIIHLNWARPISGRKFGKYVGGKTSMRLQKKKTVEWLCASYTEAFSFLLIACSPTSLSKMFTVCPFHSQMYRKKPGLTREPQTKRKTPEK